MRVGWQGAGEVDQDTHSRPDLPPARVSLLMVSSQVYNLVSDAAASREVRFLTDPREPAGERLTIAVTPSGQAIEVTPVTFPLSATILPAHLYKSHGQCRIG